MICWTDFFKKMSKFRKENLSLSGQKIPETILGWFLALVFATRVLQNHMFRQALGAENDFPGRIHPDNLGERKII